MEDLILKSVKELLTIEAADSGWDNDVLTHIGSTFGVLRQLGVAPAPFTIDENSKWSETGIAAEALDMARAYVFLKVAYAWDTPATSFLQAAKKEQIAELEWRLHEFREVELHG